MNDRPPTLPADVLERALDARDARFDGLFFVGITTTRIYCRPICPARVSYPERRRFFESAAAAEHAGFRPCLRCRPELAPGRALIDAVPRLASRVAHRIAAGALNGPGVVDLARELGVSERHLRRALEREIGVSPLELAITHRLLLAKRLLADTSLSVTRIAFASGFQSLRRFNATFRERYRMSPTVVRRTLRAHRATEPAAVATDAVRLTLSYRPPLAWHALTALLRRDAIPGVECVEAGRYARAVRVDGACGVVFVDDVAAGDPGDHLDVHVSPSLVPVLMPLLARLRRLFDLDAEPLVVDDILEHGGLGPLVRQRRGLRLPGAFDGFETAWRAVLCGPVPSAALVGRIVDALGVPIDTGHAALTRLTPSPERIAAAGAARLVALGARPRRAAAVIALARAVAAGALKPEPGSDVTATRRALLAIDGVGDVLATQIVMRALHWPDAFPASDRALQRAAGASNARALLERAEQWRPWRAYAALHLWLLDRERAGRGSHVTSSVAGLVA